MASSTIETDTAPPVAESAPRQESNSTKPHGEPLLLPASGTTAASYPGSNAEQAAASKTDKAEASPKAEAHTEAEPKAAPKPKPTPEVEALNMLLRGEMAAIETYRQALEKFGKEPGADELKSLESEHREAAGQIYQNIQQRGGDPVKSSGAWGAVAKAFEGTAKLFGNVTALAVLKEGEEHGRGLYRDLLSRQDLAADSLEVARPLLAKQEKHVGVLDGLIAQAGAADNANAGSAAKQ